MSVESQYALILGLMIGLSLFFASRVWFTLKACYYMYKIDKLYRKKKKEREAMLDKGEVHEWVTIPYGMQEVMVCKKTGWCPSLNGFIPMNLVGSQLKLQDIKKGFDEFKNQKLIEWAKEFNVTTERMQEFVESVYNLKKQYYTDYMEKQIIDMLRQERFGGDKEKA